MSELILAEQKQETDKTPAKSMDSKPSREEIMKRLYWLLNFSLSQVVSKKPSGQLKRSWVQTCLYAIQIGNSVLRDAELEQLKQKVEVLERAVRK